MATQSQCGIVLKSRREIELMRTAGALVHVVLARMEELAHPGATTAELNAVAEKMIADAGARALFKGVKTPQAQDRRSRTVARAALEWGCPFVLYWEMYCNEKKDGRHRGFWLIDDRDRKQPIYHTHRRFLQRARRYVSDFQHRTGRTPTPEEYRKHVITFLADPGLP